MSNFALVNSTTLVVDNVIVADTQEIAEEFSMGKIVVNLDETPEVGIGWQYDQGTSTFSRE